MRESVQIAAFTNWFRCNLMILNVALNLIYQSKSPTHDIGTDIKKIPDLASTHANNQWNFYTIVFPKMNMDKTNHVTYKLYQQRYELMLTELILFNLTEDNWLYD